MTDEVEDTDEGHGVPEGLLELHVELEDAGVSPSEFEEVFGNADGEKS